jgi:hypothetical protein
VTQPKVTLTTTAGGATGVDYLLTFNLSGTGGLSASGSSITVSGPAGTKFTNTQADVLDVDSAQQIQQCCVALSNSDETITIPAGPASGGHEIRLLLSNVQNPTKVTTGNHLAVKTTSDTTVVNSTAYAITTPNSISAPTVAMTTKAASASGVDYRLFFTLSSTGALTGTGDFIKITGPAGTSFDNVNNRVRVTDTTLDERVERCCAAVSGAVATGRPSPSRCRGLQPAIRCGS